MRSPCSQLTSARDLALIAVALIGACAAKDGSSVEDLPASVCPSCEASAGGETGDFSGTPSPCTPLLSTIAVDEQEARTLGYDVAAIRRQLARSIDVPMSWGAAPRPSVSHDNTQYELAAPQGYTKLLTRISIRFRAGDDLRYERVDPNHCDGGTCQNGAYVVPQGGCEPALHVALEAEIRTGDDALRAKLTGRASLRDSSGLHAWTSADLASAQGELRFSPKTDLGSIRGRLTLSVRFNRDEVTGDLTPSLTFGAANGTYKPITAHFQGSSAEPPVSGQSNSDKPDP